MRKGCLVTLEEMFENLTPMEKKAARYILDHPEQVIHSSVQRLQERTEVSAATFVRLSRALQYKGFQELKLHLAADLANEPTAEDSYAHLLKNDSPANIVKAVANNNMKSIRDTLDVLDVEEVARAIHMLSRARKIAVFGVGSSAIVAEDFKQKVSRLNKWCESAFSFDSQAIVAANLDAQDAVLAVSYSGQTEELIQSAMIAKERGATLISLTQRSSNPISGLACIRLSTSTMEQNYRNGAMSSRIAQLLVVDMLYVGLINQSYEASVAALARTKQAVQLFKKHPQR